MFISIDFFILFTFQKCTKKILVHKFDKLFDVQLQIPTQGYTPPQNITTLTCLI
jgi:hypothetical protein